MPLKSPYPWFGGKARAAAEVWRRFGDPPNYVEPFFGGGACLLARPPFDGYRTETVNDLDGHVANFWRAMQADPDEVAHYAAWPVSELDLHARGDWLFYRPSAREWVEQLRSDPDYYDAKSAGWWVWFVSSWIGALPAVPEDGRHGQGGGEDGIYHRMPHLGNMGNGVNRKRPHLGDMGMGVNRQLPILGDGKPQREEQLKIYFNQLAARLERVRVCCGDWSRVTGPSVTFKHGLTAVFLDPPYSAEAKRTKQLYSHESDTVAHAVREWAIANGDNPLFRIALCGYDSEHNHLMPENWRIYRWKAPAGYGGQRKNGTNENRHREVIWFSPHCLPPEDESQQAGLFAQANGTHA